MLFIVSNITNILRYLDGFQIDSILRFYFCFAFKPLAVICEAFGLNNEFVQKERMWRKGCIPGRMIGLSYGGMDVI